MARNWYIVILDVPLQHLLQVQSPCMPSLLACASAGCSTDDHWPGKEAHHPTKKAELPWGSTVLWQGAYIWATTAMVGFFCCPWLLCTFTAFYVIQCCFSVLHHDRLAKSCISWNPCTCSIQRCEEPSQRTAQLVDASLKDFQVRSCTILDYIILHCSWTRSNFYQQWGSSSQAVNTFSSFASILYELRTVWRDISPYPCFCQDND